MARAILWMLWAVGLAAGLAGGCAERPKPLPNLVILTLDTLRADHLGCYGYFRNTSPALDRFAEDAVLFERCYAPMATTLPSHVSLMTGTYPLEHGVLSNRKEGDVYFLETVRIRSLASFCRELGYRTAAFVSGVSLDKGSGIEQGYEVYREPEKHERDAERTTALALDWLDEHGNDGPFHLWVHYFDPHYPYVPRPPGFRDDEALEAYLRERRVPESAPTTLGGNVIESRAAWNAYDSEIVYMDRFVGTLLERLERLPTWNRTYVVIAGDHGEGLCQHDYVFHSRTWGEQLHAPLLLRAPAGAPARVALPVSLVDVLPTLLGRIGDARFDPLRAGLRGRDVLAPGVTPLPVFSQDNGRGTDRPDFRVCLTSNRWKCFWYPHCGPGGDRELYDLAGDPYELRDVAAVYPDTADLLVKAVRRRWDEMEEENRSNEAERNRVSTPIDSETVDMLRSIGYVDE